MPVRRVVKRLLLPSPGVRRLPLGLARGVRMYVDFDIFTQTYLAAYEIELYRYLKRMLQPGVTTFDVGVQYGFDSLLAANQTAARVAAFECDPGCIEAIRRNFDLNPALRGLMTIVEGTVGSDEGEIGLDRWAYADGGFVPDFIKLDIDGGEVGALRSAARILSERRPSLVVETHSPELERDCGAIMVQHGYRPVIVRNRIVWPESGRPAHNRWLVAFGDQSPR
jgi:hypothetical protein